MAGVRGTLLSTEKPGDGRAGREKSRALFLEVKRFFRGGGKRRGEGIVLNAREPEKAEYRDKRYRDCGGGFVVFLGHVYEKKELGIMN